jgi:drug/metabolite transporter (DMT)-like permease
MRDRNPLRGVLLAVLATLAFAASDILTKQLTAVHALGLVMALRYAVNLGLLAVVFGPREGAGLWRVQRRWLVLLRALCLSAATLTMVLALRLLPVAETIAIMYLSPFAVMLLSGPLLKERVSAWGWVGAAVGFGGVLLILRPGGGLDPLGVVFALINTGFATAYHLLTRTLTRTETTTAMLFHAALVGAVIFGVTALIEPWGAVPGLGDLALMGVLGGLAMAGHLLFTAAYVEAPAGLVAPVGYVHLVWAAILGWLVFGHWPADLTLLGIALVIAAGAFSALQARQG